MNRNKTRNERKRNKYRMFFWISVAVWAAFAVWVMAVPAQSKDAQQTLEMPVAAICDEAAEQEESLPGDDLPAAGYANLELLESLGEYKVTAYCSCVDCCGVWSAEHPSRDSDYIQKTASGTTPKAGRTVAADWSILPVGTEIIINGETYTVEDTGSAVSGNHVDIYMDDHDAAREWGVQYICLYREAK